MSRIYLDHNATTAIAPEVRRAMTPFLEEAFGNPSSIHEHGRQARDAVERARDEVARLVGATRDEVVFTSGGTEANNLAVQGGAEAARAADGRRVRVLLSPLEHPSVAAAADALAVRGFRVERLRVDARGRLDEDDFARRLGDDVALATVQWANHELGNVSPIERLAARARAHGVWFHSDAVQAAGKLPIDLAALDVGSVSLSAHKLYGPKGAGALVVRGGRALPSLLVGGHQERARRPGTENVPGVVGLGAAARLARERGAAWGVRCASLRDRLEAGACAFGAAVNGDPEARVANTSNLSFAGCDGELVVINLDLAGASAATGAACSSGSVEPSPVLLALGQSREVARTAVRFSVGWDNTVEEMDRVLALLPEILARVRAA